MISTLVRRDLLLAWRSGGTWLYGIFFFVIFLTLTAIAFGGSLNVMRPLAPAFIWLALIFSALLSFPSIFRQDFDDGTLAQFKLSGVNLTTLCLAKTLCFSILSLLPLLLVMPVVGLFFDLSTQDCLAILASLVIAGPAIAFYGVLSSALLAARKSGGFLIVIITTPFLIPLMIFGLGAVDAFSQSGLTAMEFQILAGLSLIAGAICLPAAGAALDVNLE